MRLRSKGKLGADDYIIIFAGILSVASTILAIWSTKWGNGYKIWDVKPEWVPVFRKIGVAGVAIFTVAVVLPKISVCFTYLLLFPSSTNVAFCWSMIVLLSCWAISTVCVTIFQCRPAESYWDVTIKSEYCINPTVFNIVTAVINSGTDFIVYLWPIQYLWGIQIPIKQKLGVMFLFVIGVGACIAGITRIYYIHKLFGGYQYFWYGSIVWIVSSVETNIGIIFTCMHAMRPVLSRLVPGFFSSAAGSSKRYAPNLKTWTENPPTSFGARLKSIAAKFVSQEKSRPTKDSYTGSSGNDNSLASNIEFSTGFDKDYFHSGSGKVNALITTGPSSGEAPADSIMYNQHVVVVRESPY